MSGDPKTSVVERCQITMLVLILIGVTGNTLSIVTLCGRGLRNQSSVVYLQALAVADILVLLTCMFRYRIYYLFLTDDQFLNSIYTIDAYFDVYIEPVYWMSLGMASFITLLVTVDRYIAIRFPLRMRTKNRKVISIITLFIVIAIPISLTVPNFFYYTVETYYFPFANLTVKVAEITPFGERDNYRCVYFQYIIPFLWYIIPWIALAILNVLLVRQVMKSAKVSHGTGGTLNAVSRRHNRNLTLLMIVIIIAFLVFNLPKCITVFIRMLQTPSVDDACAPGSSGNEIFPETTLDEAEWIVSVFNTANSSVNFIFYCVIGERFRREFRKIFCCCKCKKPTLPWSTANNTNNFTGSVI